MGDYERVLARHFCVCREDPESPPGVTNDELERVLTEEERVLLRDWNDGLTVGNNGIYVWDLDRFLGWLEKRNTHG